MELLHLKAAVIMGSLFLFPAVAVFLRRHPTMLWVTTGIGVCLILWFAAFAARPAPAVSADLRLDTRAATGRGDCCGASSRWLAGEISQPSTPVLLALALHHWRSLRHGRLLSGRPTIHTRCFLGRCRESVRFWKKSPKGQPQEGGSSPSGGMPGVS